MDDVFSNHNKDLSDDQEESMMRIKEKAAELLLIIEEDAGTERSESNRYRAIAKTHLEIAIMMACKAVCID